ncbi:MAG: type II toxin-antitoxin system VapC family toxin [Armatimonadota bacterium]
MIYLLDTDHCSVLQRGGSGYDALADRLSRTPLDDYGTTIVSYEEQCRGWADRINRANTSSARIEAYSQLQENLRFYRGIAVWEYTANAELKFSEMVREKVRVGTKDLRIAAIALTVNAVVLTRNSRDFSRVPGLTVEDWT